jgi:hypothetical protein
MNADAQAYRSAIEFGQKMQRDKLGMMEENARLRADIERLAREMMDITVAGAKAYEEAERLRLNFKRITGWDDEQLEQGMIHLEAAAMVKARRLAGTEHRQARSLGDQALGVCATDGESWPCRCALAGTKCSCSAYEGNHERGNLCPVFAGTEAQG